MYKPRQILNGVLKAMVEQLGRGYAIMGVADLTTDPGTPDAPESWFASTPGTYTNFGGLVVADAEFAIFSYTPQTETWEKTTLTEGIKQIVCATHENGGHIPNVEASYEDGVLTLDFYNLQGLPGENATIDQVTADLVEDGGQPDASVATYGTESTKSFAFTFKNLKGDKGETGVTSVVATVDNTSGTPACTVSLVGQQLTLAFTGLKGAQGDTGSSVDYPFTIVNNLTTDDATQALSAAQGVVLEGEITQLEAEVDEDLNGIEVDSYTTSGYNQLVGSYDLELGVAYTFTFDSDYSGTMYIAVQDANGNALIEQFAASSFPVTKTYTPSTNISGAKIKIGHSGSGTVDVKVQGKGRLAKFDELYEETASKDFYKRSAAATTSAINEKIDISSIPDGAQIIYHLTTLAGSSAISVALMNSDSTILTQYVPAQGDSFVIQKVSGLKYIRTYKGAVSGNIADFEIKAVTLPYKIDFRDSGLYGMLPFQKFYLGNVFDGYYNGNIRTVTHGSGLLSFPVNFTSGMTVRINCTDFSNYKVWINLWNEDFSLAQSTPITAQTDINIAFGYGWNLQFRKNDYSTIYPWDEQNTVTATYISGTIVDRSPGRSELTKVEDSLAKYKEMALFYDEFRTRPFIYHYAPNALIKDGAGNDLIGGQSEDDIRMAARLGFRWIEANIHKTSDNEYIVMHGNGNDFGGAVYSLDNTDISGVAINTKTLSWIKQNVRFASTVDKYKTPVLSIEEFCTICRENGLGVLAGISADANLLPVLQRIMGNNLIIYGPTTNIRDLGFGGIVMEYKSSTSETVDTLMESANKFGRPYLCSIGENLYNTLATGGTIDSLFYKMHKSGYLVGMSYLDSVSTVNAVNRGVDLIAAGYQVNPFNDGTIYDINGDTSAFSGTGTISGNEADLAIGETIIAGGDDAIPLGKGEIVIKFDGELKFNFGSVGDRILSSDGASYVRISDFFLRRKTKLIITAMSATTITELVYKVKKC